MQPTSDERREVAARLRKCGAELSIIGADCETALHVIDKVVGCREVDSWERFLGRLADLIDSTCHMTDSRWDNGECTWGCICSACGARIEHEYASDIDYCPNCGARVVSE